MCRASRYPPAGEICVGTGSVTSWYVDDKCAANPNKDHEVHGVAIWTWILAVSRLRLGCIIACVAGRPWIRTPRGWRRNDDLDPGDVVFSVDLETGELVKATLAEIRCSERACLELSIGAGEPLVCTTEPPVFDPRAGEYVGAGRWVRGERDAVLAAAGDSVEIREVTQTEAFVGVRKVYDLTVDSEHANFVANGIVVYHKKTGDGFDVNAGVDADAASSDTGQRDTTGGEVDASEEAGGPSDTGGEGTDTASDDTGR